MKKVVLPGPIQIGERAWTAADAIREILLCRDVWRRPGNIKVMLAIEDKLEALGTSTDLTLSEREHELLVSAGVNKDTAIGPPVLNRYYARVLSSFYDATEDKAS